MSVQVFPVPGQTEGIKKTSLEWKSIDLFSKVSLTCGVNVNYYKTVHHPIHDMKSSAKFEEKLSLSSKNDMRNLD